MSACLVAGGGIICWEKKKDAFFFLSFLGYICNGKAVLCSIGGCILCEDFELNCERPSLLVL